MFFFRMHFLPREIGGYKIRWTRMFHLLQNKLRKIAPKFILISREKSNQISLINYSNLVRVTWKGFSTRVKRRDFNGIPRFRFRISVSQSDPGWSRWSRYKPLINYRNQILVRRLCVHYVLYTGVINALYDLFTVVFYEGWKVCSNSREAIRPLTGFACFSFQFYSFLDVFFSLKLVILLCWGWGDAVAFFGRPRIVRRCRSPMGCVIWWSLRQGLTSASSGTPVLG